MAHFVRTAGEQVRIAQQPPSTPPRGSEMMSQDELLIDLADQEGDRTSLGPAPATLTREAPWWHASVVGETQGGMMAAAERAFPHGSFWQASAHLQPPDE